MFSLRGSSHRSSVLTDNPNGIIGQFLAGDEIVYSCNGDLIPDEPTTITCQDMGPPMAVWSTALLPNCSKLIITTLKYIKAMKFAYFTVDFQLHKNWFLTSSD